MGQVIRKRINTAKENGPDPVDVHVGYRVRLRRTLLGYTQQQLGEAVGVTFQQMQKYERGTNRLSASRLYDVARVLGVPISFFFEDLGPAQVEKRITWSLPEKVGVAVQQMTEASLPDDMSRSETLDLVNHYWRIPVEQRPAALALLKAMARKKA